MTYGETGAAGVAMTDEPVPGVRPERRPRARSLDVTDPC